MVFYIKFAVQTAYRMELYATGAREHDEKRQGEAFMSERKDRKFDQFFYVESYGCAMNFADSEVVASILENNGYGSTRDVEAADLILVNTCSEEKKQNKLCASALQNLEN